MKEKNSFKVKEVEVEVLENGKLRFMKDGKLVEIDQDSILGNYRKVYNYLKSKNNRSENDFKEVGNFLYKIENNILIIKRKNSDEMLVEIEIDEDELKYPRNYVINYLINNL